MVPQTTTPSTTAVVPSSSIAKDLGDQYAQLFGAEIKDVSTPTADASGLFALVPTGLQAISVKKFIDEYRDAPERRTGTARVRDVASFIAHVNRFKDEDSVIFALPDRSAPSLTAVLDYHQALEWRMSSDARPRFGAHRTVYHCPLAEEWKAWTERDGKLMSQADFAAFLEDRIGEVIVPPNLDDDEGLRTLVDTLGGRFAGPSALVTLSRGLQINVETAVRDAVTLDSGEIAIQYVETHKDGAGAPIRIPNLFLIAIPVFYNGAAYRIPVRLRYRLAQGRVQWSYHLVRVDRVFDHAFGEVCEQARDGTQLPLYLGTPEG